MLRASLIGYVLGIALLALGSFQSPLIVHANHLPTDSSTAVYQWVFRDYLDIKDDTGIYGSQIGNAVSNWSSQLAGQGNVLRAYATPSDLDIWIVKAGYFEDTYLAQYAFPQYLGASQTRAAFSSNPGSKAHTARAYEQGFGPTFFGQPRYGRICLNYDGFSGATVFFSEYDSNPSL